MKANDWKIGFEIVSNSYVARVPPIITKNETTPTYWLYVNEEMKALTDEKQLDFYRFDRSKIRDVSIDFWTQAKKGR